MPEQFDLVANWQNVRRGKLHEVASWSPNAEPNLTYVPTGAGFTGLLQLQRFISLFPSAQHPLAPEQLKRYNNEFQVVIAHYADDGLLTNVRIYWDHATLLRQLGVFHLAFHNLIHVSGKATAFENELDQIPIVDGVRIVRRLVHPIAQNSNLIMSLECVEATKGKESSPKIKLSPKMAHNLPSVSPQRQQAIKNVPAFASSVFKQTEDPQVAVNTNRRVPAALVSHLVLGDEVHESARPIMSHVSQTSIFGEQHDVVVHRPSITIDPMRNTSKLFEEPSSPFHPSVPLTDRSRFESRIFSDSPLTTLNLPQTKSQLKSHIFDEDPINLPKIAVQPTPPPFGTDDERLPLEATRKSNLRLESHFSGSGFIFHDAKGSSASFSGRSADPRANLSSIRLTDEEGDVPRMVVNSRAASHNQSQIMLGDNPSLPPVYTSTRVSQPPGGHSTIFRE